MKLMSVLFSQRSSQGFGFFLSSLGGEVADQQPAFPPPQDPPSTSFQRGNLTRCQQRVGGGGWEGGGGGEGGEQPAAAFLPAPFFWGHRDPLGLLFKVGPFLGGIYKETWIINVYYLLIYYYYVCIVFYMY